jgi:hypothetical protein
MNIKESLLKSKRMIIDLETAKVASLFAFVYLFYPFGDKNFKPKK